MIHTNDVIHWNDTDYRVLHLGGSTAHLYPMSERGIRLVEVEVSELLEAIACAQAQVIEDPYAVLRSSVQESNHSKKLDKLEANYRLLSPLIDLGEQLVTDSSARTRVLAAASDGNPSRRRQLVRLLCAFWKKGQCKAALLPEYHKHAKPHVCTRKPGRRFLDAQTQPPPIDDEIRELFKRIIDRYVLKEDGLSMAAAHARFLVAYQQAHPEATTKTSPSIHQFRYFFKNYKTFTEKLSAQTSQMTYDKDKRSLHGSTFQIARGIGHVYELDSTKSPVYLVAEFDRAQLIGQPTIYVLTDLYSRMIVGFHVCVEEAQYSAAAAALLNALEAKTAFLQRCDPKLHPSEWPVAGLPHTIKADNAELSGKKIESFARANNICIENTRAYRGDQKPTVESSLGELEGRISKLIEAKSDGLSKKKEGRVEKRDKATLTISEYRSIVMNAILDINRRKLRFTPPDYPFGALPTPADIWSWASNPKNSLARNYLRRAPRSDLLALSLYEQRKATVSREGIRCDGILYDCERARELGWFERDRLAPRPKGDSFMAINPNNVSQGWFFASQETLPADAWPCRLSVHHQRFAEMPMFEVQTALQLQKQAARQAEQQHQQVRGKMMQRNEQIVKDSKKAKPETTDTPKQQIEAMARNRRLERGHQARKEQGLTDEQANAARKASEAESSEPNSYEYPDDFYEYI